MLPQRYFNVNVNVTKMQVIHSEAIDRIGGLTCFRVEYMIFLKLCYEKSA